MIKKLLPILFAPLFSFTAIDSVSHTPDPLIDRNFPAFRLGDYEKTTFNEFVSAGDGQVNFYRIQVLLPVPSFEALGQFPNVYITIPNYSYNPYVNLHMRIDNYDSPTSYQTVFQHYENVPLSQAMLNVLPYTVVDIGFQYNMFNPQNWEDFLTNTIRLTFVIPFTAYTNPQSTWSADLNDIMLFTHFSDEAYNNGYAMGSRDGYNDGYKDGKIDGYDDGYKDGDYDGYYRGVNEDFNAYSYLFGLFGAFGGLFSVEILPGLTIGGIVILVLTLTLLPFLIGLFTKGGKK